MDMGMQHGHGHAAWTWACSMDMGMQHGHGHAAWTGACSWKCSMNMDMDMYLDYWTGPAADNFISEGFSEEVPEVGEN
jgi:hypothetical protein